MNKQPTARNENIEQPSAPNEKINQSLVRNENIRLRKYIGIMKVRNIVLSKTNMLLRSELQCTKKRAALIPIENVITAKKCHVDVETQTLTSVSGDESATMANENEVLRNKLGTAVHVIQRLNQERKDLLITNLELLGKIRVFCRLRPNLTSECNMEKIDFNVVGDQQLKISENFFFSLYFDALVCKTSTKNVDFFSERSRSHARFQI